MYAIATEHAQVAHLVTGNLEDVRSFGTVVTLCGRTVKPLNYFHSVTDYVRTYNCHGRACLRCEEANA